MNAISGRLARLADSIEARLANERADRQTIAEDAVAELRTLARMGAGNVSAELAARRTATAALAADFRAALGTSPPGAGHGMYYWALRLADMLGLVLNALDEADTPHGVPATLGQDQPATVLDALDVAAEYRRYRASLTCEACAAHPAELCEDHAADLDRADEYDTLAHQITEATVAVRPAQRSRPPGVTDD